MLMLTKTALIEIQVPTSKTTVLGLTANSDIHESYLISFTLW